MAPRTTQYRASYEVGNIVAYDLDNTYYTRMVCDGLSDVDHLFMSRLEAVYLQRKSNKTNGLVQRLRDETGIASIADKQTFYWKMDVQGKAVENAAIAIAAGSRQGGWPIRKLDTANGKGRKVSEAGIPDWASKILKEEDIPLVAEMGSEEQSLEFEPITGRMDSYLDQFDHVLYNRKTKKMPRRNYSIRLLVERRKLLNAYVPV